MKNLNLTDGEIAILKGIIFNEYNDPFIEPDGSLHSDPVWTWSVFDCTFAHEVCKGRRSMSGYIGSLVKKGLVGTDATIIAEFEVVVDTPHGEKCVWLTTAGKKFLAPLFNGWEKENRERWNRLRK